MKKAEMKMQANRPRHLRMLVGGVAAILVSGIAIGSLAISDPRIQGNAPGELSESATASPVASPRNRADRCAECGVIESLREIEGIPLRSYEITIRMQDGSMLVITDPNPAKWRHGERVTIMAGVE